MPETRPDAPKRCPETLPPFAFPHAPLRAAIDAYDATRDARADAWARAETPSDIEAAEAADWAAVRAVREAFADMTADRNSRASALCVDVEFARRMLALAEADTVIPEGMVQVDRDRFFELLKADPRDIMPHNQHREFTLWEVQATRQVWGWSAPGYGSPHGTPRRYAVQASVVAVQAAARANGRES